MLSSRIRRYLYLSFSLIYSTTGSLPAEWRMGMRTTGSPPGGLYKVEATAGSRQWHTCYARYESHCHSGAWRMKLRICGYDGEGADEFQRRGCSSKGVDAVPKAWMQF
ncbi:hypothetical protein EDB86DRAFT_171244 [Lactarius hatsudake]|nr:hypothetical protein EDB86DRAFT_171244 [Lactarius hatsudake]